MHNALHTSFPAGGPLNFFSAATSFQYAPVVTLQASLNDMHLSGTQDYLARTIVWDSIILECL
jgi:hypothetical protein